MDYPKEFIDIADEIWVSEGDALNPADGKDKDGNPIPSYLGILQTTYEWYKRLKSLDDNPSYPKSVTEFGDLTIEHRRAIFYEIVHWWTWERSGASDIYTMAPWFAGMVADWYMQSGGHAIKPIQRKAGCADVDGHWGPNTAKKVDTMLVTLNEVVDAGDVFADNEFVKWYDHQRRSFLMELIADGKLPDSLRAGLHARCDKALRIALEKVEGNDNAQLSVPKTIDDEFVEEIPEKTPEGLPPIVWDYIQNMENRLIKRLDAIEKHLQS